MKGKLLIVEDQAFFRQGIRVMVESSSLGWEVVAEASNGKEAVKAIQEHKPDLILTDIRMPKMDGIQLIRYIHDNCLDCLTVILTGYKDFEYAQAALRYGAMDFLLKPCSEEMVELVLNAAYVKLRARLLEQNVIQTQRRSLEDSVFRAYCTQLPYDAAVLQQMQHMLNNSMVWFLKVQSYLPTDKTYRPQDQSLLLFALLNIIDELGERSIPGGYRVITIEYDKIIVFLNTDVNLSDLGASIVETADKLLGLTLQIRQLGRLMELDPLDGLYQTIFKASITSSVSQSVWSNQQDRTRNLRMHLMSELVTGNVEQALHIIADGAKAAASMPLEESKLQVYSYSEAVKDIVEKEFHSVVEENSIGKFKKLQQLKDHTGIVKYFQELTNQLQQGYQDWRSQSSDSTIQKVLDYLNKNYMKNVTLVELSRFVHTNDTYLSRQFKKETGENFSIYLTKLRIEKAMLLLSNTEMKIFEIASAVGYDDPNYFTSVFKTNLNISPTEFRRLHQK
jgi:two-component system response regulator YesN